VGLTLGRALLSRRYDGTVRNSAGDVVQFLYGEDGMDGVRIEGQVSETVTCQLYSGKCWLHVC
jgi:hypothetical protein